MLLFLNIDCLLSVTPPTPATPGAPEALGLPGFEAVLDAWPQLRVVITSELRYRMTIEQLRSLFAPHRRPRIIATTLQYGALAYEGALGREQEIVHWLRHVHAEAADWLALDHRRGDFQQHADRLVACTGFDRSACDELHARLLQRAARQQAVVGLDRLIAAEAAAFGAIAPPASVWH